MTSGSTMSSERISLGFVTSNHTLAVYRGVMVAVYSVDKTELSLTRSDLIELIRVRISFVYMTNVQNCSLYSCQHAENDTSKTAKTLTVILLQRVRQ